ncbi:MAG TPA: 4'-phosphopantetheinyl transferase superfamily protein, partial [Burkholderiaceae bacterium]|nr:4'-phosphopantetheinyl transferase superfamily protein [Burkholderiaceae bacterium]
MRLAESLKDNDVHIWRVLLDDPQWDDVAAVLNDAEREKAARYRTLTLRQHYRRCRSALRVILSRYVAPNVDAAAANIVFQYGQYGKPEIADCPIAFNVSHSGEYALVALARYPLGVDLERAGKERSDLDGLIDIVCHPSEQVALALLTDTEKTAQFYRLWTHKEAYCKMQGMGLQQTLTMLRFQSTASDHVWQVYADDHVPPTPSFIHQLDAPVGYAASLCLQLAAAQITYFTA